MEDDNKPEGSTSIEEPKHSSKPTNQTDSDRPTTPLTNGETRPLRFMPGEWRDCAGLLVVTAILLIGAVAMGLEELLEEEDGDDPIEEIYEPTIDPANFVEGIDNRYLPFQPGNEWTYEADTEDGTELIEVVVLNETRMVMGIKCVVVRDTVSIGGTLIEDTYDWYAQDKQGNVWYMGEDSTEYEDGKEDKAGSWEAGKDGAQPGVIMMDYPLAGFTYRQEYYKGEAEDMAQVIHLNQTVTIGLGTFEDVLIVREWNPLEPGVLEDKYYAPNIGVIKELVVQGDPETVELKETNTN